MGCKITVVGRMGIRRTVLVLAVAQVLSISYASAQVAKQMYHIPAASLETALLQIGKQAGQTISFDSSVVSGVKSGAIDGELSPSEAIDRALSGTGLERVSTSSGAFAIRRTKVAASGSASAAATGAASATAVTTTASSQSTVDTTLPLVSVQAQRDSGGTGYVAESTDTFTKSDTPISQTPKSIQVVNAAVIQSQNDQSLAEILRNSSGIVTRPGPYGVPSFAVRGFGESSSNVLTGGIQTAGNAGGLTPSIAIQSVEVLKGPNAILAGNAPAGGAINIVQKSPQADPFHEIQLGYGKYGNLSAAVDSTGAITDDKKLMYRFILSDNRVGQNDSGYDGYKNFYLSPSIEWKDSKTDIKLTYSHTVTDNPFPAYTIGYRSGGFYHGYLTTPDGNPSDGFKNVANEVNLELTRELLPGFDFVSVADWSQSHGEQVGWTPLTTLLATNGDAFMSFDTTSDAYAVNFRNYLRYKQSFGALKTTTIAGIDYRQAHETDYYNGGGGKIVSVSNVFAPPVFPSSVGAFSTQGSTTVRNQDVGFYGQEQLAYERLHVLASMREDVYNAPPSIYFTPGRTLDAGAGLHQRAFTPNIGVLYQLTDDVAAYANWNKGFQPGSALTYDGGYLPPQISEQVETGLKFNVLDDKLNITTSAYRISYTNQNISDALHPGYSVSAGGAVSKGFEVDVQGEILPGLNMIGNYTYNNYVQAFNPTVHVALPKNSASLWTTYNFQAAALRGFGLGLGLYFQGSQSVGGTSSLYRLPSQVETDVSAFYRRKNWGLNLSVKNLFNRNLYYSSTTASYIPVGTSRALLLTGTYDF